MPAIPTLTPAEANTISTSSSRRADTITDEDGKQYFVCGKNYIEIAEHFAQAGKSLGDLIEDVILYTADRGISA